MMTNECRLRECLLDLSIELDQRLERESDLVLEHTSTLPLERHVVAASFDLDLETPEWLGAELLDLIMTCYTEAQPAIASKFDEPFIGSLVH